MSLTFSGILIRVCVCVCVCAIAGCAKVLDAAGLWGGAGVGIFFGLGHMLLLVYYFGCKKRHLLHELETVSDDNQNADKETTPIQEEEIELRHSPSSSTELEVVTEFGLSPKSSAPSTVVWLPGVPGFEVEKQDYNSPKNISLVGLHCMSHTHAHTHTHTQTIT